MKAWNVITDDGREFVIAAKYPSEAVKQVMRATYGRVTIERVEEAY